MGSTPPVALPPVTAEYGSTMQAVGSHVPPVQSAYRFSRAADGKTRVDSGTTSVISDPAAKQTIVLDHTKKTATIQTGAAPAPPVPGMPKMPQFTPPGLPGQPKAPAVKVEDLGKNVMQGHEVEGKRYVIPPAMPHLPALKAAGIPKLPKAPALPKVPGAPKAPGLPQMPGAPKAPGMPAAAAPHPPTVAEVWSSTSLGVPMLTKMSGGCGQVTQVCHSAVPGEPHPTAFQIPPGYKVIVAGAKPVLPGALPV